MAFIDTVNQWFETGDYPTQAQFWQKHAWLRWKDELLEITDVEGLQVLINSIIKINDVKANYSQLLSLSTDGQFAMPSGLIITGIVVDCATDFNLSIGTTPGGNDIINALPITGGTQELITMGIYAKADKTIYISGITASTDFIILKNSL